MALRAGVGSIADAPSVPKALRAEALVPKPYVPEPCVPKYDSDQIGTLCSASLDVYGTNCLA